MVAQRRQLWQHDDGRMTVAPQWQSDGGEHGGSTMMVAQQWQHNNGSPEDDVSATAVAVAT
jgi:hypothetical protein